jgi:glycosyltransferase involved in cell wall biosynthesis
MVHSHKRHILLAIDSLIGRGAERVIVSLAETLTNLGHKVNIVIYEDIIEFDIDPRVTIHKLNPIIHNSFRILSRLTDYSNCHLFKILLDRIEKKYGHIDIIFSALPRMDRILSLIKDNRIHHVIHNPLSLQNGIRKNKWHKKISRIWHMKRIYDGRKIIVVSNGVGIDLLEFVKVRPILLRTIYNPFHFDQIKNLAAKPIKLPFKLKKKDYLLHIGAFTLKQKRQDLLIKAFADSGLKCKLVLLGKGEGEKEIRALINDYGISDRVIVVGFESNPYPWIKHARMLVLCSDYEGFGNVLVESLVIGTPALSTNCFSGPSEIFTDSMSECLVPTNDTEALAKKMKSFYIKPPKIDRLVLKRFEAETVAKQYLKLIT